MGEPRSSLTKLRGLPYDATEEEISDFFQGFETSLIHICRRDGRATGEAYVEFKTAAVAEEATAARNNQNLRHRYVEIFEIPEKNVQHVKQAQGLVDPFPGWVLRMRGLPYSATADDVLEFFNGIEMERGAAGIVFTCTPDGRPKGEAYIEFSTDDAQKEALKRHKNEMGERYIELFLSTKANMMQALQQRQYYLGQTQQAAGPSTLPHPIPMPPSPGQLPAFVPPYGHGAPVQSVVSADGSTLRLRGLPYSAGINDITDFFKGTPSGFSLAPDGIQVVTKPDKEGNQMGTGVAYVRFQNPGEAEKARKERHRQQMGARYIECLPFTASHYTSPVIPPQLAMPPPYALGQYPRGGAPLGQSPYGSLGPVGRGLPVQLPQQYGGDAARMYGPQPGGLRGSLGPPGRGRGPPGRGGGRSGVWVPAQQQAPGPPPLPSAHPGPRPGRGYPPQAGPRGGPGRGPQQGHVGGADYATQQQAASQQHQQMLLQQHYLMQQHMMQQRQYMAGGWPGYSDAQLVLPGAPPSPSWYQLPGQQGMLSSAAGGQPYAHSAQSVTRDPSSTASPQPGSDGPRERPAATAPLDADQLPAASEITAAVLASPPVAMPSPPQPRTMRPGTPLTGATASPGSGRDIGALPAATAAAAGTAVAANIIAGSMSKKSLAEPSSSARTSEGGPAP